MTFQSVMDVLKSKFRGTNDVHWCLALLPIVDIFEEKESLPSAQNHRTNNNNKIFKIGIPIDILDANFLLSHWINPTKTMFIDQDQFE